MGRKIRVGVLFGGRSAEHEVSVTSARSMLEAIAITEKVSGKSLQYALKDDARSGDHIWWISDVRRFQQHYREWSFEYDIERIITELTEAVVERERTSVGA